MKPHSIWPIKEARERFVGPPLVSPKKKGNRDTAGHAEALVGTKGRNSIPGKRAAHMCIGIYVRICSTGKREARGEAVMGKRSSWLGSSSRDEMK